MDRISSHCHAASYWSLFFSPLRCCLLSQFSPLVASVEIKYDALHGNGHWSYPPSSLCCRFLSILTLNMFLSPRCSTSNQYSYLRLFENKVLKLFSETRMRQFTCKNHRHHFHKFRFLIQLMESWFHFIPHRLIYLPINIYYIPKWLWIYNESL